MKRVLVTGAEGFCGAYLCRTLSQQGYRVAATYHKKRRTSVPYPLFRLDITKAADVSKLIRKFKPDFVCHLAAQSNARLSWSRQDLTFKLNILGTLNLAKALLKYAPKAKLLYTSSVQVYGRALRSGKPIDEKCFLWPENPYAVSKVLSELGCLDLSQRFGLNVVIARANNLFGQGQTSDFVFADWCRQIAEAEVGLRPPVIEVGNVNLKRDFLPVEDGMAAYILLLRKGKKGEVYNLSSGSSRPLRIHLDYLIQQAKIPLGIQIQKDRLRQDDPPAVRIRSTKLRKLGWKLSHSTHHHLQKVLEEWRKKVQK